VASSTIIACASVDGKYMMQVLHQPPEIYMSCHASTLIVFLFTATLFVVLFTVTCFIRLITVTIFVFPFTVAFVVFLSTVIY
jgi:hypothetical protein